MARKNPTMPSVPKQDKHESMVSNMHSALYSLSDKMRKPYPNDGDKLLPSNLKTKEKPESKAARKHVEKLHKAMCAEKNNGK